MLFFAETSNVFRAGILGRAAAEELFAKTKFAVDTGNRARLATSWDCCILAGLASPRTR